MNIEQSNLEFYLTELDNEESIMLTKQEIKQGKQWRKGIGRKGLNLASGNNVKLGKKQKHMTADERYDFIVRGK